jgi:uncharacterized protein (DUF1778 family)
VRLKGEKSWFKKKAGEFLRIYKRYILVYERTIQMSTTTETSRITARISSSVEETLKQAAELTGMLLNQFMVQASLEKAQKIIDREIFVNISYADAKLLLNAMDVPPKQNTALASLFERHKGITKDELLNGSVRQKK